MLFALVGAALAAVPAPPVSWAWPSEPAHFHLETLLLTPRGKFYFAKENLDADIGEVRVRADTTCTAKPEGKNAFVTCTFAWIDITGRARAAFEQEEVDAILQEWATDLAGARVSFVHTATGQMREIDLEGLPERRWAREGAIQADQRILMRRVFALFDLPLPTKGEDWVRGWISKQAGEIWQLQTGTGTSGAAEAAFKQQEGPFGTVDVFMSGRATLAPGAAVDSSGAAFVDVRAESHAWFDPGPGLLVFRDLFFEGRRTASSVQVGADVDVLHIAAIQRLTAPGTKDVLPLSVAARRAPRVSVAPPPPAATLVPFESLGMAPLFVTKFPEAVQTWALPTTTVKARVEVNANGSVASVKAFDGYEALTRPTEDALSNVNFAPRDSAYTVDVAVEWRAGE